MKDYLVMEGDQYAIPLSLKMNGVAVTANDVQEVEFAIGNLKKYMSTGDIVFADGKWNIKLTQADTFQINSMNFKAATFSTRAQIRVKFKTGDVIGYRIPSAAIAKSISEVII